jgi:hydrogenase maturation protease
MNVLVLALGNELMGDDAAGLVAAELLENKIREAGLSEKVDIVKTAKTGLYLIDYLDKKYDHIIFIDSIVGKNIGDLIKLDYRDFSKISSPSPHYSGIKELLSTIEVMGLGKPHIDIYAIVIEEPKIGFGVSDKIKMSAEKLSQLLFEEIKRIVSK